MGSLERRVGRLETSELGRSSLRDRADALRYLTDAELDELQGLIGVDAEAAGQLIARGRQRRSSLQQACQR